MEQIKRMESDQKDSAKLVERLLKAEPWIKSERQLFGKPGTDYDFDACDIKEAKETYEKKQAEQDRYEEALS
jgi:structural maintenance of chromosome 2